MLPSFENEIKVETTNKKKTEKTKTKMLDRSKKLKKLNKRFIKRLISKSGSKKVVSEKIE